MNKGHFLIICETRDQAYYLKRDLGDMAQFTREDSMSIIDYPRAAMHGDFIGWRSNAQLDWKPIKVPSWRRIAMDARVMDSGLILCLSPDDNADTVRPVLRDWLFKRAKQVIKVYRELRYQYPTCTCLLIKINPYTYQIRMNDPRASYSPPPTRGIDPFNVPHAEIQDWIRMANIQRELAEYFPNLTFRAEWFGQDRKYIEISAFPSNSFRFAWPKSDPVIVKLVELNYQVGLGRKPDMFFCTNCEKAKPQSEYAGFLFDDRRCKDCADEKWLYEAKNERYN